MKKSIFFVLMILFVSVSFSLAQTSSIFPQDKIDKVIFEQWQNRGKVAQVEKKRNINKEPTPFGLGKTAILPDRKNFETGGQREILYIGPGSDTLLIDSDYEQDGDIIIFGEGTLLVDNAKLTLSGQLYAQDQGRAIFRNNAHLHFDQYYVGQYFVWLVDSARFEATDATVDANGVMHYAQ